MLQSFDIYACCCFCCLAFNDGETQGIKVNILTSNMTSDMIQDKIYYRQSELYID